MTEQNKNESWREDSLVLAGRLLVGALIAVAVGGLLFAYQLFKAEESYWSAILLSISASVISYLVTLLLHSSILERRQRAAFFESMENKIGSSYDLLEKEMRTRIGAVTEDVKKTIEESDKQTFSYISRKFPDLIPSRVFPPSDTPLSSFIEAWDESAKNSKRYVFRGVTARHIGPFLSRTNPQNLTAQVFLLDPRNTEQIWLYSRCLYSDGGSEPSHRAEQIKTIQSQIYFGVFSLLQAASFCVISVKLHSGGVFFRSEIFDDTVLVSFLTPNNKNRYPAVYAYQAGSIYHDAFAADIGHLSALDGAEITMTPNTTEDQVLEFLKGIGFEGTLEDLKAEADKFRSKLFTSPP